MWINSIASSSAMVAIVANAYRETLSFSNIETFTNSDDISLSGSIAEYTLTTFEDYDFGGIVNESVEL